RCRGGSVRRSWLRGHSVHEGLSGKSASETRADGELQGERLQAAEHLGAHVLGVRAPRRVHAQWAEGKQKPCPHPIGIPQIARLGAASVPRTDEVRKLDELWT